VKKIKLSALILVSCIAFSKSEENNFNITNSTNNNFIPNTTNKLKNSATQTAKSIQKSKVTLPPSFPSVSEMQHHLKNYLEQSKTFWQKYKRKIIVYSLLGAYSTTLVTLIKGKAYLKNKNLWSSWPYGIDFETLLKIPQKELFRQIMQEINTKYPTKNNTENFVTPLSQFLHEIEKEKEYFIFYLQLYDFLQKFYLIKLFPISKTEFKKITNKIRRLDYLKNLLLSWSTERHTNIPVKKKGDNKRYSVDNITVEVTNTFSPTSKNYLSNSTIQSVFVQSIHYINDSIPYVSSFFQHTLWQSQSFIKTYKKELLAATGISTYLAIFYFLIKGETYLKKESLWSCWPNNIDFQEFIQISHKTIEEQLLQDIQVRYIKPESPTDFITPLILFMNDIEQEKKHLTFYLRLHNLLSKTYLSWIFPVDKKRFLTIKEKLERLTMVKNMFLIWAAQYKINQNKVILH